MAISSSFKQQCPSCEAMVPIRDPKLIGRKIDCPKCKYRFVVEEPVATTTQFRLGSVAAQRPQEFRSALVRNHFCHRAARHGNNCLRAPLRPWC